MAAGLRLFVYGTLKTGFAGHDRYCGGGLRAEPAWLPGRLFKLSPRVPIAVLPDDAILAVGSRDIPADLKIQERFQSEQVEGGTEEEAGSTGGWARIEGELLVFNDPEARLPRLDRFEEFYPGGESTYKRVLVRITLHSGLRCVAWTYAAAVDTTDLEPYEGRLWLPDQHAPE